MPAARLTRLEREFSSTGLHTEGVRINIPKGTHLYSEIKRMLKKRRRISDIKGMALL